MYKRFVAIACLVWAITGPVGGADTTVSARKELATEYGLSEAFAQIIADRALIDGYQERNYRVEPGIVPTPKTSYSARNSAERSLRVVRSPLSEAALRDRASLPESFIPLRGYRASLSGHIASALLPTNGLSAAERNAAGLVTRDLAHDGLVMTLARMLETLGPAQFVTNGIAGLQSLNALGLPTDLLGCFSPGPEEQKLHQVQALDFQRADVQLSKPLRESDRPLAVVRFVAQRLARGATAAALKPELDRLPYCSVAAQPGFQISTESGEHLLGLMRLQAGGGYLDGVVPGGNIDGICQLVATMPKTDFLISVPQAAMEPFQNLAMRTWRLHRAGQVTLIPEPLPVSNWAQDNGKAGTVSAEEAGPLNDGATHPPASVPARALATLTPRYASVGEGQSTFRPAESFLMDGVSASGHAVVRSGLLFQGGNLLAVRDPKSGERILLVGEGELSRNVALGLTPAQALSAFRVEFGVDRCIEIPAVSYHLDFDVSVRAHGGKLVAFVNDTAAVARRVAELGITALEQHGILGTNIAQSVRADLATGRDREALGRLRNLIDQQRSGRDTLPSTLSRCFVVNRVDDGAGNLQCFLLAMDVLEVSAPGQSASPLGSARSERADYLAALSRFEVRRRQQADTFRNLGWKVVTIPSMTDLYRSINYLNGIHHAEGYVMPVFGGFYASLDSAAQAAFRETLGQDFKITTIQSAECQRKHGGVHCMTAVYPHLPEPNEAND